jgi:hypothetical protein
MIGLTGNQTPQRLLAVLFAALFSSGVAPAQTSGVSGNFQYMATATEVTITHYPGNLGGSLSVPSTINGIHVTTIGAGAFDNCQYLTSISLPTSIKILGTSAFSRCSGLSNFPISSAVTSISGNVFTGCSRITSVSIPASVPRILSTFHYCRSLTTITVDSANPSYSSREGMLFNEDFSVLIRVPGGKTGKVVVEEGTTAAGAFSAAYLVDEVVLPESNISINDYMFAECESLRTFVLPEGFTSIGQFAFRNCDSLEGMIIPDTVQTTGRYAFASCSSLIQARLPTHLTVIGDSWFVSCESLTDINIPPGLVSIGDDAFSNAKSLANVVIPESVEHIGARAFFVTNLRTVRIPAAVQTIGVIAFSICTNLLEIEVAPENQSYASLDRLVADTPRAAV